MAHLYNIIIGRAVRSPNHGKDGGDGLNVVIKYYLTILVPKDQLSGSGSKKTYNISHLNPYIYQYRNRIRTFVR